MDTVGDGLMNRGMVGQLIGNAIRRNKARYLEALFASLFINFLALAVPVFMLQIYDRVVFHHGLTTLQGLVVGMVCVIAFDGILRLGRARLFQKIGLNIDIDVGRALYDKIMKLPLRVLEGKPASSWQILFRDVDAVRGALAGPTTALVLDLPFAILFFLTILWLAPPLAGVIAVVLPVFVLLAWRSGASVSTLSEAERVENAKREALIGEIIAGRATVKALGLGEKLRPEWEMRQRNSILTSMDRGRSSDSHVTVGQMLSIGTTVAITCVGALLILEQSLTIGALIASNMLASRLVAPIASLVGQWKSFQAAREAAQRLNAVLEMEGEHEAAELPFDRPAGKLQLEEITFRYGKDLDPAVDRLDGVIGPNGLHCIIGRNGSGKSTFFKLLAGLYRPDAGRVLLDGADISQFPRRQLTRWIGYMPQEVVLFSGTIRENILMGSDTATDDDLISAAKLAGVHELIAQMPMGYETDVGEAGHRLSGGQRRRLAAARALIGDPPVLLLDEPSGDLDGEAEKVLAQALRALAKDHTILVTTHSPALLSVADTILVLDRGRVAMAGGAREVLGRLGQGDSGPSAPRPAPKAAE